MQADFHYSTCAEVAKKVVVNEDTVRTWIANGELEATNVAKSGKGEKARWRISESSLSEFLKRRSNRRTAPAVTTRAVVKRTKSKIKFF